MDSTIFRPIADFPGYAVSETGEVISFKRSKPTLLKPYVYPGLGYLMVGLTKSGVCKKTYIHTLVAQAFLGDRPEGYFVDHKDGNKLNNRYSNLHYVTPHGNANNPNTLPHNSFYRKRRRVVAIKDGVERTFDSVTQMGRELGVDPSNVFKCIKGKQHSLRGYTFRWAD